MKGWQLWRKEVEHKEKGPQGVSWENNRSKHKDTKGKGISSPAAALGAKALWSLQGKRLDLISLLTTVASHPPQPLSGRLKGRCCENPWQIPEGHPGLSQSVQIHLVLMPSLPAKPAPNYLPWTLEAVNASAGDILALSFPVPGACPQL